MNITPDQIDSIDNIGTLDGNPLKMVKLIGGFYVCVGKPKGKFQEEALGAGSHPAIVKYNIEKQYPGVEITMMKSELLSDGSIVDKHSHFLSSDLRKSGHDIYSIQSGLNINFYITKQNMNIATVEGKLEKNSITIEKLDFPPQFSKGMAGASIEKAMACKAQKIRLGNR